MSQYKDSLSNSYDNTQSKVEGMAQDAKSRFRDGLDSAKDSASNARDFMNEKMHDTRDRANELGSEVRDGFDRVRNMDREDVEEVWDGVKDRVRDNPGPALLIAAGVGLAIGLLMAAAPRRR